MIKKLTNHILSYLISSNAIDDNEETKDYYRIVYKFTNQYVTSYIVFLIIIFSCIIFFSECPVENKNKVIKVEI